jgi:hypothetical protein
MNCTYEIHDHCELCILQGYVNWTHVPGSEFRYNVTILNYNAKNHYQFAISANSRRLLSNESNPQNNFNSSGMVWESCTIQNNISKKI